MNELDALLENSPYTHIPGSSYIASNLASWYCYACHTHIAANETHIHGGVECRKNYHALVREAIVVPEEFKTDKLPPFLRVS